MDQETSSDYTPVKSLFTINRFAELPKRIYVTLLCNENTQSKYKPKALISQLWDAIVIPMYREHLLSLEDVQRTSSCSRIREKW